MKFFLFPFILVYMTKKRTNRKITFMTFAQSLFITIKSFAQNKMPSYAEACSFGLLFSFIPIFMLTVIVIVRILHASPEFVSSLLDSVFSSSSNSNVAVPIQKFIEMISNLKFNGYFEIFIGFFAFWMSRRFLVSIFQSFKSIFHTQYERKSITSQLLMLGVVTIIIFAFSAVTFAYITVQSFTNSNLFHKILVHVPQLDVLNSFLSAFFIRFFPNILIFILITVLYKVVPGTKPSFWLCVGVSLFCTTAFWCFRIVMHFFLSSKSYNALYGVLGQLIILLLDIFFFFTFVLFCAQFIFVCQFFDDLLIGELYLLPKESEKNFASAIRRKLFLRPDFLIAKDVYLEEFNSGDIIFEKGDSNDETYFVVEGTVQATKANGGTLYSKGDFFGEIACTLQKPYDSTARAITPATLVKIEGETFRFLVDQDTKVARKTLSQISSYFSDYYGKLEFNIAYDI